MVLVKEYPLSDNPTTSCCNPLIDSALPVIATELSGVWLCTAGWSVRPPKAKATAVRGASLQSLRGAHLGCERQVPSLLAGSLCVQPSCLRAPNSAASSLLQYQVGQLYSVAEASKNETGGGEGVEVLVNEPYERDGERGQYTHKIYHLQSKVPPFVRMLAPEGALDIHEKAWNAYPFCRTVITNEYMKDDFLIKIETWHKADMGMQENVHKLDPEEWKNVEAVSIDIADRSPVLSRDYKPDEDPAKFKSVKTGRGPLGPNWKKELGKQAECPYMCAYKLVTVKFKWWGLQNKIENFIQKQERRLFTNFHRQLFCWLDKWVDLTMEDIRRMEDETKRQLDEVRLEVNSPFSATDERERPSERHVSCRRVAWIPSAHVCEWVSGKAQELHPLDQRTISGHSSPPSPVGRQLLPPSLILVALHLVSKSFGPERPGRGAQGRGGPSGQLLL
ncbi:hypothetical protein Chor_009728 [Crotalus horridus]